MRKIFYIILVMAITLLPFNGVVKAQENLPSIPLSKNKIQLQPYNDTNTNIYDLSTSWSGIFFDENHPNYYKKDYVYATEPFSNHRKVLDDFADRFKENIINKYDYSYIVTTGQYYANDTNLPAEILRVFIFPKDTIIKWVYEYNRWQPTFSSDEIYEYNLNLFGEYVFGPGSIPFMTDEITDYHFNPLHNTKARQGWFLYNNQQNAKSRSYYYNGYFYIYTYANTNNNKIVMVANNENQIYPENYTGETPPSTITPEIKNTPNFLIDLKKNGELSVMYMQNLLKHPPEFYYKLGTGIDASNNMTDEIDSKRVQFRNVYKYNLENYGDYYLEISPNYHPPTVPPDDPPPTVKFKITHDGTDKIWGNNNKNLCDEDGILCVSPEENCASYTFFLEKHACLLKQNSNLGVINTSILEMTKIYSKMRVDEKNYTCGFNLPAFRYQNKNVFNTSAIVTEACQKSEIVHSKFNFIKIVVNFSFLMGVLWLFSRIINKILNRDDNNITEGLE